MNELDKLLDRLMELSAELDMTGDGFSIAIISGEIRDVRAEIELHATERYEAGLREGDWR